jgi:hypothetical protein
MGGDLSESVSKIRQSFPTLSHGVDDCQGSAKRHVGEGCLTGLRGLPTTVFLVVLGDLTVSLGDFVKTRSDRPIPKNRADGARDVGLKASGTAGADLGR